MEKQHKKIIIAVTTGIVLLSASVIVFFNLNNSKALPIPVEQQPAVAEPAESSEVVVPEITIDTSTIGAKTTATTASQDVLNEAKDVTKTEENGIEVQTPNWDKQKELTEESDLKNPDKTPEYKVEKEREAQSSTGTGGSNSSTPSVTPPASSTTTPKPTTPATPKPPVTPSTPSESDKPSAPSNNQNNLNKDGVPEVSDSPRTKTENGKRYDYVDGFGWIEYQGDNIGETIDFELSGNKVGY